MMFERPTIRLFLIRHGLSEANLDKSLNARVADHAVPLAQEGHGQAAAAGRALAAYLEAHRHPDGPIPQDMPAGMDYHVRPRRARMFVSPYRRTRETANGLTQGLGSAVTFDRREATELRELSFGLFDGIEDDEIPQHYRASMPTTKSRSSSRASSSLRCRSAKAGSRSWNA